MVQNILPFYSFCNDRFFQMDEQPCPSHGRPQGPSPTRSPFSSGLPKNLLLQTSTPPAYFSSVLSQTQKYLQSTSSLAPASLALQPVASVFVSADDVIAPAPPSVAALPGVAHHRQHVFLHSPGPYTLHSTA